MRRVAWAWLLLAVVAGMMVQGVVALQMEPRSVKDAWQDGYEAGYLDASGQEYEGPTLLDLWWWLLLPVVLVVGLIGLAFAVVRFKRGQKAGA